MTLVNRIVDRLRAERERAGRRRRRVRVDGSGLWPAESSREAQGTLSGFLSVRSAGFTLLEIMIVLAIIALIAGGVGAAVFRSFNRAKLQVAKQRVKAVREATAQYMIDNNNCPQSLDALVGQKYLDRNNAKDPWDKPFIFKCPGTNDTDSADVSSAGPDKQEGTADDIKSWEM